MKKEIKLVCKFCGKEAPIDTEKSNENWKVYKQNEKCECGKCDYIPDILLDKNKINKNMDKKIISKCCGAEAEKPAEWNNYLYFCPKCHKNCEVIEEPQPIQKEEECEYCEGLGFRTESIENDVGSGDIEQVECPKCKGKGSKQKEEN